MNFSSNLEEQFKDSGVEDLGSDSDHGGNNKDDEDEDDNEVVKLLPDRTCGIWQLHQVRVKDDSNDEINFPSSCGDTRTLVNYIFKEKRPEEI